MSFVFEELDAQDSPIGVISLRKRAELRLDGQIVYEVKLGDEFLMSSLFTEAEIQLSTLALNAIKKRGQYEQLDVVVGGLGLGYTAVEALNHQQVDSLVVIDIMEAVIDWHQRGLVPLGKTLTADDRCTLFQGDFFAMSVADNTGFYPSQPEQLAHAVLLDIDHSPSNWLAEGNSSFYSEASMQQLAKKLYSGGVFGVWSTELPEPIFIEQLEKVFIDVESHVVSFPNPYTGGESINTVYLAFKA